MSQIEMAERMCYEDDMKIEERQQRLVQEFAGIIDWEARYRRIIELGKALEPLPEEFKIEDLKVQGCQSQVWLKADLTPAGLVVFRADSDALIVRGLIAILLQVFSQSAPAEILAARLDFLDEMGLKEHLSPSRANGLMSMVKQIKYYAAAFQVLVESQRP